MTKLWVKLKTNNATQVSTEECQNVDDFLEACKEKLSPDLDSIPASRLSLSITEGGPALRPGVVVTDIPSQPGYSVNDDEHPLFITATDTAPRLKSFRQERYKKLGVEASCRKYLDAIATKLSSFYEFKSSGNLKYMIL